MSMPPVNCLRWFARLAATCLLAWLAGCAQFVPQTIDLRADWPAGVPRAAELADVPFFPQTQFDCGPASLATIMNSAGTSLTVDELVQEVYLPARQGSLQVEMLVAPRRHGLVGWQLPRRYSALLEEVANGRPVLVLQNLGLWPLDQWHYAVVVGFDYERGELYLRSGTTQRLALPFTIFEVTWRRSGYWAMVASRPESIPASATEASYRPALLALGRVESPARMQAAWSAYLARWPGDAVASIALSNLHYQARALGDAEVVLRSGYRRNPESVEVLNNLSQVLSELGRNEEALQLIDRAAQLKGPFQNEVAATRNGILKKLGR
jgi:hypothetical protein